MRCAAALLLLVAAPAARAQTMLDQEQRLIQIHSLLLDLPPAGAPGALRPGELLLGVEAITVPPIDGTTGSKRQLTASDRTPVFPRPRAALGLPLPRGYRAFIGLSYIPPVEVARVSTHTLGGEAGIAWAPGPLRVGLRAHLVRSVAQSPVTDPVLRDTLRTTAYGADLLAAYEIPLGALSATPYAGAGVTHLAGNFRVTSDSEVLTSDATAPVLHAGASVRLGAHLEAAGELGYYPGRLLHPNFRLSWLLDLGS